MTHPLPEQPLPCPFCGGEASAEGKTQYSASHGAWWADGTRVLTAYHVNCMRCGVDNRNLIGGHQTREKAIEAWNRRSPSAPDGQTHYDGCWRERGHHACAIAELVRRSSRGKTAPSDIAFNAAREGYLRGLDGRRDDGFEMAMASAEAFAREYCDARWPAAGETAQESTAVDAKERETVERALAFVADFHGDARCALNCHHSEALAREVQRLRRQLRSPISPTRDTLRLDYLAANYTSVSDGYLASGVVAPLIDGTHGSVVLTGGLLGYVPRESPDWFRAAIDAAMGHSLPESPTFDELVAHGLASVGPSSLSKTGMPWSFEWRGHPVTHENDDLYLIRLPNGQTLQVARHG